MDTEMATYSFLKTKASKPTHPWYHAINDDRDYLTPEDIGSAIKAGGSKEEIWEATLQALESGASEDPSCCAFVALKMESE